MAPGFQPPHGRCPKCRATLLKTQNTPRVANNFFQTASRCASRGNFFDPNGSTRFLRSHFRTRGRPFLKNLSSEWRARTARNDVQREAHPHPKGFFSASIFIYLPKLATFWSTQIVTPNRFNNGVVKWGSQPWPTEKTVIL